MPDYQTITPPFWKGYILIECSDGKIYKYVRNVTKRALTGTTAPWKPDSAAISYIFGDSVGDTIGKTGDTAGRILWDFNKIVSVFTANAGVAGSFLKFPESGGDTITLKRINKEQLQPLGASTPNNTAMYQIPGDTLGYMLYDLTANTYLRLAISQVQSISMIQERIPLWYTNQQAITSTGYTPYPYIKI
jgi:hypothetical protein